MTVMMPTANLRSDGSKLFREVYLCIASFDTFFMYAHGSSCNFESRLNKRRLLSETAQGDFVESMRQNVRGKRVVVRPNRHLGRAEKL